MNQVQWSIYKDFFGLLKFEKYGLTGFKINENCEPAGSHSLISAIDIQKRIYSKIKRKFGALELI